MSSTLSYRLLVDAADQVTPDVGGILKNVYYPSNTQMLALHTDANVVAFYDLSTNTRIQTKKYPENTPGFLLPSSPYLMLMGSCMEVFEFRENNVMQKVTIIAVSTSRKNEEIYLGMLNKLAVLSLDSFSLLRQKNYDNLKIISKIEFNQNHKYLILIDHRMKFQ